MRFLWAKLIESKFCLSYLHNIAHVRALRACLHCSSSGPSFGHLDRVIAPWLVPLLLLLLPRRQSGPFRTSVKSHIAPLLRILPWPSLPSPITSTFLPGPAASGWAGRSRLGLPSFAASSPFCLQVSYHRSSSARLWAPGATWHIVGLLIGFLLFQESCRESSLKILLVILFRFLICIYKLRAKYPCLEIMCLENWDMDVAGRTVLKMSAGSRAAALAVRERGSGDLSSVGHVALSQLLSSA